MQKIGFNNLKHIHIPLEVDEEKLRIKKEINFSSTMNSRFANLKRYADSILYSLSSMNESEYMVGYIGETIDITRYSELMLYYIAKSRYTELKLCPVYDLDKIDHINNRHKHIKSYVVSWIDDIDKFMLCVEDRGHRAKFLSIEEAKSIIQNRKQ